MNWQLPSSGGGGGAPTGPAGGSLAGTYPNPGLAIVADTATNLASNDNAHFPTTAAIIAYIANALIGEVVYKGTWNATTNTPTLTSGAGTNGYYYRVATAGSTSLDGFSNWLVGDLVIFNGVVWQHVSGASMAGIALLAGAIFTGEVSAPDFSATGLTGAVSGARLVGGTTTGAPVSGTFAVRDMAIAGNGHLFVCTVAGSPGTWVDAGSVGNLVTSVAGRTGAVTLSLADLANIADQAIVGNNIGSSGPPIALTASQVKTLLSLVIGTNVEAWSAVLDALASVMSSTPTAAAQRTALGLGTLATQSGTFSGTSSGTNTGDQTITLTGDVTGSGTGSFAATLAKLIAQWDTLSTTLTTGTSQPNSLADSIFTGKVAGGAVNGAGVAGIVAASFASSGAETGTSSAQGGLGSAAASGQPYNVTDFPGQRGIKVGLQKANGDTILLINVLSTAVTDMNEEVYGYLSYRSDLGANLKWRLWYYYRRSSDGVEVPVTPNASLTNCILYVAEVLTLSSMSVAASLGNPQFGEFAAEIGPNVVTNAMSGQMATLTMKGNNTGVTANQADLTVAQITTMLADGTTLDGSGAGNTLEVKANGVGNTQLAQMANKTYKGRHTAGTGNSEDVSAANLKSDLAIANTDVSGLGTLSTQNGTAPSGTIVGTTDTQTLTSKRITKRVLTLAAGSATPAINTDSYDAVHITAQSAAITSFTSGLTGTPVDGDLLRISITDDGTPRTLAWGASFEASTVALPTTTVISTRLDVGFIWNTETSKWRCVAAV